MKKIYLYAVALLMGVVAFSSCNDDHDQLTDSWLTHYVIFDLQGDDFVIVPIGSEYHDAGCKGTLLGEDYTSKIVTEGVEDIDVNTAGLYYVTYSAENKDGYVTSITRTVAVCDPTVETDLTGKYKTQKGSTLTTGSGQTVDLKGFDVTLNRVAPGHFEISDLLGGFYDQRAGYGPQYALTGYIQLTADNKIHVLSGQVPAWGDSFEDTVDGTYDPETGEFDFQVYYYVYWFHIILNN